MNILLSVVVHLIIVSVLVFAFALCTMHLLNPTATTQEIFAYWGRNFRNNQSNGKNKIVLVGLGMSVVVIIFGILVGG